jgi:hypothetical protein
MGFMREKAIEASGIADIAIEIFDPEPNTGQAQTVKATMQIRMDDGMIRVRDVDLTDVLSAQAIDQLTSLAATIRDQAILNVLPASVIDKVKVPPTAVDLSKETLPNLSEGILLQ